MSGSSPTGNHLECRAILDSIAEPVTVIAPDYRVKYINAAARALFGLQEKGAGDVLCYEVSHHRTSPCSGNGHPCPMEEARRTLQPVRVLHEHYDAAGEKHTVEIIASPLAGEDGVFSGIVESQRDVTEREEADCLLRSYAEDMRKANKIKDLFIDIMRHDLLGPAGVIRGTASLGMRRDEPGLDADELELVHRSSRKMINLIQNASVFAKLQEPGKLDFEPTAVKDLIRGAVDELKGYAAEKKVSFKVEIDAPCTVSANAMLTTVFTNLLSNAVKYGPMNAEVVVAAVNRGGNCLISVADRGEGIADEDKEEIFTRFSRLQKRGVKGSGLGLAIVQRVVDLHDGRCWVENNPGGGSIFYVELKSL